MIVGIDAGCLGIKDERLKVGVYRMSLSLLQSLSKIDKKNFYNLYSFYPIEKKLLLSLGPRFKNIVIKPQKGWFNIWLPLALQKNPVDVFIGLSQSLPKLPDKTRGIVIIHDLTFEKCPQWFPSYKKMSANSYNAAKKGELIIAVSQATKKDLIDIYQVDPQKIEVIYEGFDNRLKKVPSRLARKKLLSLGITKPYFLFIGTFKQSKNIPNILKGFSLFSKDCKDFQLVFAGSDYWLDKEINSTLKDLENRDLVKILGFVSDHELSALYSQATLFVSPSFNEGFGLTYLEAAYFGLPIIASKKGSIEEILGKAAFYVDPTRPEEISKALYRVSRDLSLRERFIKEAQKEVERFSWKKSAKKLLQILKTYEKK